MVVTARRDLEGWAILTLVTHAKGDGMTPSPFSRRCGHREEKARAYDYLPVRSAAPDVGLDIAAVQADIGQHAVIKGFEALLHPAAMRVHANFTNHLADPAHQVEAGTIAHFNSAVCDYDDHCIHSFKALLQTAATPTALPRKFDCGLLHCSVLGDAVYGSSVIHTPDA
jgi:hypothetical protein